jgi:capsid protein
VPTAPYKFLEKRSSQGYVNNRLVRAATQNTDREQIGALDNDIHRNVSILGRRTLMTLGRWVYTNIAIVRGALHEKAEYASSHYLAQYTGINAAWGEATEEFLYEHGKICDVAGWPYTARTYRRNLIIAVHRDGDMGTLLTHRADGYPQLQCIPGHRIASRPYELTVTGGPYDGAALTDGVITNEYGAPIAYRILTGNPFDYETHQDISAVDMFLTFVPTYVGQVRGFSTLGAGMFDWQDIGEWRNAEMMSQKINAAISLVEENEEGEPAPGSDFIVDSSGGTAQPGTPTGLVYEKFDKGLVRYFKSKSGSGLKAHISDRPSAGQEAFEARIIRSNFAGLDWSVDFSLDPTKIGGASMRVCVDKINRAISSDQDLILEPSCRRYNAYVIASVMSRPPEEAPNPKIQAPNKSQTPNPKLESLELGTLGAWSLLPFDAEWFKWEFQGPAQLTADKKYNSDVDAQEVRIGIKTRTQAVAERGESLEDVRATREKELDDLFTRAQRQATKHGLPIDLVLARFEQDQLGGATPLAEAPPQPPEAAKASSK